MSWWPIVDILGHQGRMIQERGLPTRRDQRSCRCEVLEVSGESAGEVASQARAEPIESAGGESGVGIEVKPARFAGWLQVYRAIPVGTGNSRWLEGSRPPRSRCPPGETSATSAEARRRRRTRQLSPDRLCSTRPLATSKWTGFTRARSPPHYRLRAARRAAPASGLLTGHQLHCAPRPAGR